MSRPRWEEWRPYVVATLAAAAIVLPAAWRGEGLFPTVLLWRIPPWNGALLPAPGNGLLSDQLLQFWPWRLFLRSGLAAGSFPFWNPLIAGGVPFAGCVQAAPFYPTSFLLALMSPTAWSLCVAFLKILIAGIFAGLFTRRLGGSPTGAALSAASYSLCGFMIAWLGHPQTNVACLLPALFWAVDRAFEAGSGGRWASVALVVGGILLGGHPPTALHVLAAGGAYAIYLSRGRRETLYPAAAAAVAGAALAAPALLPYFEYLSWSSTGAASAALSRWQLRLPLDWLVHLLLPLASGTPARGSEILSAGFDFAPSANFLERAAWVGLPTLTFAALAVRRRFRDARVRFLAAAGAVGILAALGAPPFPWIWRLLPGFSQVNPIRLLVLFCFATSTLAGLGVDEDVPSRRFVRGALLVAAVCAAIDVLAMARIWNGLEAGERGFAVGQLIGFALEAAAALILATRRSWRDAAPLLTIAVLLRFAGGLNTSAPASTLFPATPASDVLQAEQKEGRFLGLGGAFAPDSAMPLGLRDVRGRDFSSLRRYEEILTGRAGDFEFFARADEVPSTARLLSISAIAATDRAAAGVPADWVAVSRGAVTVYRAPRAARRAVFTGSARWMTSPQALALVRAPDFDPGALAVIDDWFDVPNAPASTGVARVVADAPDQVEVEVNASGPGWLVLLDNWYPGWRAEINGVPAAVRRADYAFRGVYVPGGVSRVKFRYVPYSFWWGVAAALVSASALAIAALTV